MRYIFIITTFLAMTLATACPRNNDDDQSPNTMNALFKKDKSVEFDNFRIELSQMRGIEIYTAQRTTTGVKLEYYMPNRQYNEQTGEYDETKMYLRVIKGDQQLYEEICQWLSEYKVKRWDGFHGANPIGLRDGTMMTFEAVMSDGERIYAHGSNNFPRHYKDFENKLVELFSREDLVNQLDEPIAFDSFQLKIIAARGSRELYTGERTQEGVRLEKYYIDIQTGDKELTQSVNGDQQCYEHLCQTFNECRIDLWDGFDGPNPPDTYDGETIYFDAQLTNGKTIHAKGENNYPEDFFIVRNAIEKAIDKN